MRQLAADRPTPLHKGMLLAALGAAMLMVLAGGCGQFNDNPSPGGSSFTMSFASASGATPSSATASPMTWDTTTLGPLQVRTVVVGAIVITHNRGGTCPAGSICPYTDSSDVNDTNRDLIQQDAEQSVNYLGINPISGQEPTTVDFAIPPDGAGPWQLIGIGLQEDLSDQGIADVKTLTPIYYGFVPQFLNGLVYPGQPVDPAFTLTLKPWCFANGGPTEYQGGVAGCP